MDRCSFISQSAPLKENMMHRMLQYDTQETVSRNCLQRM